MPATSNLDFSGLGRPLADADMAQALAILGLDAGADMPALWSVLTVESRGFGFLADRRPKLLFERHIFFKQTDGRFAATAPDLCAKTGGGYVGGGAEYDRLARALALCRVAGLGDEPALRSASWGLGQVMGFNADAAGFQTTRDMVTQMAESESAQLAGMARFMASQGLDARLRARDWTGFARRYNGPSYWKNAYDVKLKSAFEKFSSGISRDLRARAAQGALLFLGFNPGDPDGVLGQNTRRAIAAFRADAHLAAGDALDDAVFEAIMSRAGLAGG
ncbi:N-acetylmuramidase domain-containing protein [Ottowia sp.]|uniref:N-acetylmuramidase domain-containing protein n=1 Tax=Ottowia sp. TaxID=1898956 RepID=UPI0025E252AD|nr:N-acetylmuramidase domain-containing protein [Ottowia sp.]